MDTARSGSKDGPMGSSGPVGVDPAPPTASEMASRGAGS